MRTYTREYTVYTIDELRERFPEGFARAHSQHQQMVWEVGIGHEAVRYHHDLAEEDHNSPLTGRFIEWSVYPGFANYEDGPLTTSETEGLVEKFPALARSTVWLEGGEFHADTYQAFDEDAADEALKEANKWLAEFTERLYEMTLEAEKAVESEDYFIGEAEANEWEFHADGSIE